jgi:hypothetical protein
MLTIAFIHLLPDSSYRVRLRGEKRDHVVVVRVDQATLLNPDLFQVAVLTKTGKRLRPPPDRDSWTGVIHKLTQ